MSEKEKQNKAKLGLFKFKNWSYKYKFVVMNESTLDEKISFQLSRLNVFIAFSLLSILIISFTIIVIGITPLKEYIPGYASIEDNQWIEKNARNIDTLRVTDRQNELWIENFRKVIGGEDLSQIDSSMMSKNAEIDYENLKDQKSPADSLLRQQWENNAQYDLIYYPDEGASLNIHQYLFFTPLKGTVTNGFNAKSRHYGIDVVGVKDQAVKATLEGTVLFSSWTYETGYTLAIQHNDDLISVYKHNSALLKEQGDHIKPGDPVAIVGNTGHQTSGPHLHFELWYRGNPVDPAEFISFE